ncbi:MAG: hypothetical protein ACLUEJ_13925 [Clostridium sp.]
MAQRTMRTHGIQTEKALEEVGDKIAPGDKAEVEADLNSLKEAINRSG